MTVRAVARHVSLGSSAVAEATYKRDQRALSGVVGARTEAKALWDQLARLHPGQGLSAPLAQARALHTTAEELYAKDAYPQAKTAYQKLLIASQELSRLRDQRAEAQTARDQAEQALAGVVDPAIKKDPASLWNKARKASQQAKTIYEKGQFSEAKRLWSAAAADAGQQNASLARSAKAAYEKALKALNADQLRQNAPTQWAEVEKALKAAQEGEKTKRFDLAAQNYRRAIELLPAAQAAAKAGALLAQVEAAIKRAKALLKHLRPVEYHLQNYCNLRHTNSRQKHF